MTARRGFTVREARPSDIDGLAHALGRAFADDPVWGFIVAKRPATPRTTLLSKVLARVHLGSDTVLVAVDDADGAVLGAAMWAAPGHWRTPLRRYVRHLPDLVRVMGVSGFRRLAVLQVVERVHPREPEHHYLAVLGTDPDHQGRGVGSELMAPVLEQCDREGIAAYLESSKDSNVPFYRRHGFEVGEPLSLHGGPTMYPMLRPAPA